MTTQYTPTLKLALPVTGELSGTWGDIVNDNITSMIEQAIAGLAPINTWSANTRVLTTADGTTSESRCAMLVAADGAGGTALTGAGQIICPAAAKLYVLRNNSTYAITLKTSAGTGVSVPAGQTAFLFCDGTNVNACVTTIVDGNISGNLTVSGNATINGNTTLGNATSDTITATARFNTDLVPSTDNARDLGSAANSWKDLFIDGTATMALVAISGGTINGVSIGATTAATIINVDNLRLDGNTISSTDTNGNVVIAPNGTGDVQLDADTVRVGDAGAAVTLTSNGAGALTVTTGGAANLTLSTNSGTTSGAITIANGTDGNISLTPNGTGRITAIAGTTQLGLTNTDTFLTTNGTGNLNLTTNSGTNSGVIQIAQGVNGSISLTPNGTGTTVIKNPSINGGVVVNDGTANGVAFLNGSKVLTTGSALTFDGSNLGVGMTPSAWASNRSVLQLKGGVTTGGAFLASGAAAQALLGTNSFSNGTNFIYLSTGARASLYDQSSGAHAWLTSPVGTAGNAVTFTTAMLLDEGGRLYVGTSGSQSSARVVSSGSLALQASNGSPEDQFPSLEFYNNNSSGFLNASISATVGTTINSGNITFNTNNSGTFAERARISQSGSFGLGVIPNASITLPGMQIRNGFFGSLGGPSTHVYVSANAVPTGSGDEGFTTWRYLNTGEAARFDSRSGIFRWFNAPAGTAGNAISFTQAMTLDASGNLVLGGTSANYRLDVRSGSTAITAGFGSTATTGYNPVGYNGAAARLFLSGGNANNAFTGFQFTHGAQFEAFFGAVQDPGGLSAFVFQGYNGTSYAERARITAAGNLGVGTTSPAYRFVVSNAGAQGFEVDPVGGVNGGVNTLAYNRSTSVYVTQANYALDHRWIIGIGVEAARINSDGNLLVGASSGFGTSARLNVLGNSAQSFGVAFDAGSAGAATSAFSRPNDGAVAIFYRNWAGGGVGQISVTSTATAYITSSDYRLKEDVQPMTGALAKIAALKPRTYKWKVDGSDGEGFVAHELAEVCPQAVTGQKDAVNEDGSIKPQGIDTSFLVATLTAAIQEQQAIITALTARVAALESN